MVVSAGKSLHKVDSNSPEITTEISLQQIEVVNNEINRWYDLLEIRYKSKCFHMQYVITSRYYTS